MNVKAGNRYLFKENANMNAVRRFKIKFPYIYYALVWTPILALLALFTGGAGHGVYIIIKFLYPYTTILTMLLLNEESLVLREALFCMGFLQYIFYGVILTVADRHGKKKEMTKLIVVSHIIVFILCLILLPKPF